MVVSVDFEVFGVVQGVWFRKYTAQEATRLGLVGYCENTKQGTVQGRIQGSGYSIQKMKEWLATTGSPLSKIDKCVCSKEHEMSTAEYESFSIQRTPRS